jgi:hypothetical protein
MADFEQSPIPAQLVVSRTADAIELRNRVVVEVRAASYRRLRGLTAVAVCASEKIPEQVADIYRAVHELEARYKGRKFTPEGHLVGSTGGSRKKTINNLRRTTEMLSEGDLGDRAAQCI